MSGRADPELADEPGSDVPGVDTTDRARDDVAERGTKRVGATDDLGVEGPDTPPPPAQPWAWHAVRVSGLFLAVLIVGHFTANFVLNDVGQTNAVTVSHHWRDATWRALEWVTLVLALAHGGFGIDTVLRRRPVGTSTTITRVASAVVIGGLAVAATVVVLTYR